MAAPNDIARRFAWLHAGVPLPAAARGLARAGVPVFPCQPDGKRPLTRRGFQDATTNLRQVEAWWRRWPTANIGMPSGTASGLVVVDVDVHGPVDGYRALDRAARTGGLDGWVFQVRSPSGGLHVYYPANDAVEQRSWQAARAGIDFRGDGGYIIVPPSRRLIDGHRPMYSILRVNDGPVRPVNATGLRDFLDPRPAPVTPRTAQTVGQGVDVSRLAGWVARRQEGERNHGLFWAACKMAENHVAASDALDMLTVAAGHAGLSEREAITTVRSAYRAVHGAPTQHSTRAASSPAAMHRSSPAAGAGARGLS